MPAGSKAVNQITWNHFFWLIRYSVGPRVGMSADTARKGVSMGLRPIQEDENSHPAAGTYNNLQPAGWGFRRCVRHTGDEAHAPTRRAHASRPRVPRRHSLGNARSQDV